LDPLVLQNHIPKTAGSALRELARANYGAGELVDLDRELWEAPRGWGDTAGRYRYWYRSLAAERRGKIRCVVGHTAPLLMPAVVDRPVRAFCMLREPVERVVSHYLFARWRVDRRGVPLREAGMLAAMRDRGWTLKDALREVGDLAELPRDLREAFWPLFNQQARHVLMSELDPLRMPFGPAAGGLRDYRDRAFEILSERYVVGTQDRFSESVRLFADRLGWRNAYLPRANVGGLRPTSEEIDDETRALIREHNQIDVELHAHHSEALAALPAVSRHAHARGLARRRLRAGLAGARGRLRGLSPGSK